MDHAYQSEIYDQLDNEFTKKIEQQVDRTFRLTRNYRNPKTIANRAAAIVGENDVLASRILPSPPVFYSYGDGKKEKLEFLNDRINKLLSKGVLTSDITLLTFKKRKDSILSEISAFGDNRLFDIKKMLGSANELFQGITWSTINSFKGLENDYIFLIEGEDVNISDWSRALLYVALTRTKTEFSYFGNEKDEIWMELQNV